MDHRVIQTTGGAETVFRTMMWSPATFKDELSAPRKTLIKSGWCNIQLCLVGSALLMSGCLYESRSNCKNIHMVTLYKYNQQMASLRIESISHKRGFRTLNMSVRTQSFYLINALSDAFLLYYWIWYTWAMFFFNIILEVIMIFTISQKTIFTVLINHYVEILSI